MKLKKFFATLGVSVMLMIGMASGAQAAIIAPQYGDHVHYWNCRGPVSWDYTHYYYYCDWDYDWYAEWFWGKVDRTQVLTPAWYTA